MSEWEPSDSIPKGGPHAKLSWYLIARSPAALLADAAILLVLAFLASHLWTALADATPLEERSRAAGSILAALARPATLMQTAYSSLFYLSWFLVIWAAVRQLASIRPPAVGDPPARKADSEGGGPCD